MIASLMYASHPTSLTQFYRKTAVGFPQSPRGISPDPDFRLFFVYSVVIFVLRIRPTQRFFRLSVLTRNKTRILTHTGKIKAGTPGKHPRDRMKTG